MARCFSPHVKPIGGLLLLSTLFACTSPEQAIEESLKASATFFASGEGVDASLASGPADAVIDGVKSSLTDGKVDGYIYFEKGSGALTYGAKENFPYSNQAFAGAISFFLSVDPAQDLEANWPEPFHIGKKEGNSFPWDDAVMFVDFSKAPERALRFGCYPNKTQDVSDQMVSERVISVSPLNWRANEWHHIVITWSNFNSSQANAEWALYIDGVEKGRKGPIRQDVTWNMADQVMRFNHTGYVGKLDEIAIFNKMLTADEIKYLGNPKQEIKKLLRRDDLIIKR